MFKRKMHTLPKIKFTRFHVKHHTFKYYMYLEYLLLVVRAKNYTHVLTTDLDLTDITYLIQVFIFLTSNLIWIFN